MKLILTKCKNKSKCQLRDNCSKVPIEIKDPKKDIDLMIVGGFSHKKDCIQEKPFSGEGGKLLRSILKRLGKEFDFNYLLTSVVKTNLLKDKKKPNREEMKICGKNVKKEIKKYNPKIIIALGDSAYSYLTNNDEVYHKYSVFLLEENCLRDFKIDDIERKIIGGICPSNIMTFGGGDAGFLYTVIEKSLIYLRDGEDFKIPNNYKSILLKSYEEVNKILTKMEKTKRYVAVDTETNNLNRVFENKILSVQLSNDGKKGYVIILDHFDSPFSNETLKKVKGRLKDFFIKKDTKVRGYIYQYAKFDLHQFLREFHILMYNAPIIDNMFNEYLLEENWSRLTKSFPKNFGPYSLGGMSYKYGFDRFYKGGGKNKRKVLSNLPVKEWLQYACDDVCAPYNIWKVQLKRAKYQDYLKGFKNMTITYHDLQIKALVYIEHCGLSINIGKLRELYSPKSSLFITEKDKVVKKLNKSKYVKKLNNKLLKDKSGSVNRAFLFSKPNLFDPNANIHQTLLFYDIMGLEPVNKKGKKSVDKDFQKAYKDILEVSLFSEFRRLTDLKNGQINKVYEFLHKNTKVGNPDFYTDCRVRPTFRNDAVTGRLKANNPNVQQRVSHGPLSKEVLQMYESNKGKCLVKQDYGTFEVRGLGFTSKDKNMIKMFQEMFNLTKKYRDDPESIDYDYVKLHTDFHRKNAAIFSNKPLDKVTKEERQGAKSSVVFGPIYGKTDRSLALDLNKSVNEIKELKDKAFENMQDALKWIEKTKKEGRKKLYKDSILGRRRRVWGNLVTWNEFTLAKMDRLVVNSMIQGCCSDLNLIATGKIVEWIYKKGKAKYQVPDNEAWLVTNTIHDSAEFEIPIKHMKKFIKKIEKISTEGIVKFVKDNFDFNIKVPIEVDADIGLKYSEMNAWDGSERDLKRISKKIKQLDKER